MSFLKLFFFIIVSNLIINQLSNQSYAGINTNEIINIFCLENFKSEMLKANLDYNEILGRKVCKCYLEKISNNNSHEKSISECKIETKNNFK